MEDFEWDQALEAAYADEGDTYQLQQNMSSMKKNLSHNVGGIKASKKSCFKQSYKESSHIESQDNGWGDEDDGWGDAEDSEMAVEETQQKGPDDIEDIRIFSQEEISDQMPLKVSKANELL